MSEREKAGVHVSQKERRRIEENLNERESIKRKES